MLKLLKNREQLLEQLQEVELRIVVFPRRFFTLTGFILFVLFVFLCCCVDEAAKMIAKSTIATTKYIVLPPG